MPRLFAVLLGGNCAPRSNTELHDVVFVSGESIEAVMPRLPDLWFGTPAGLHIDSWLELERADGHTVQLRREPAPSGDRLFFVNLGAYRAGEFAEKHAVAFLVAPDGVAAKTRAKTMLMTDLDSLHTDDLYEVDDILEVEEVEGWHVHLVPGAAPGTPDPHNGYLPLPAGIIAAAEARRSRAD